MTSSSMIANDQNVPADPTSLTTGWKNSVTKNANDQLKAAAKEYILDELLQNFRHVYERLKKNP